MIISGDESINILYKIQAISNLFFVYLSLSFHWLSKLVSGDLKNDHFSS